MWQFFTVDKIDVNVCNFTLCNASVSREGKTAKIFTTSNTMNYIRKANPVLMNW